MMGSQMSKTTSASKPDFVIVLVISWWDTFHTMSKAVNSLHGWIFKTTYRGHQARDFLKFCLWFLCF